MLWLAVRRTCRRSVWVLSGGWLADSWFPLFDASVNRALHCRRASREVERVCGERGQRPLTAWSRTASSDGRLRLLASDNAHNNAASSNSVEPEWTRPLLRIGRPHTIMFLATSTAAKIDSRLVLPICHGRSSRKRESATGDAEWADTQIVWLPHDGLRGSAQLNQFEGQPK